MIWGWLTAVGLGIAALVVGWRWRAAVARADEAEQRAESARLSLEAERRARRDDQRRAAVELSSLRSENDLLREVSREAATRDPAVRGRLWDAALRPSGPAAAGAAVPADAAAGAAPGDVGARRRDRLPDAG